MIILLYGQDAYRSKQKMAEIIDEYQKKNKSGLNLNFFENNADFKEIYDYSRQVSMFDEKRLVVIKNLFSSKSLKDDFSKRYDEIKENENLFILFEEKEIRKNDAFLKKIVKESTKEKKVVVQEFSTLSGQKLSSWIEGRFKEAGVLIDQEALEELRGLGGEDLYQVKNNVDKLVAYKKAIKKEDVKLMVKKNVDTNIFNTIDALAQKDKRRALSLFYSHLEKGDNPLYIFSMIVYQFRNLVMVGDLMRKNYSYEDAKRKSGLHPFVFKKSYSQAGKFSFNEIEEMYEKLFEMDLKVKTGQIDPVLATHILFFS